MAVAVCIWLCAMGEVESLFEGDQCPQLWACYHADNDGYWYALFHTGHDALLAYQYITVNRLTLHGTTIKARVKHSMPMTAYTRHALGYDVIADMSRDHEIAFNAVTMTAEMTGGAGTEYDVIATSLLQPAGYDTMTSSADMMVPGAQHDDVTCRHLSSTPRVHDPCQSISELQSALCGDVARSVPRCVLPPRFRSA